MKEFGWTDEHLAFRAEIREFTANHATPALLAELTRPSGMAWRRTPASTTSTGSGPGSARSGR